MLPDKNITEHSMALIKGQYKHEIGQNVFYLS